MDSQYNIRININPDFENLGYVVATANIADKHDRSTPSDFHWKILKCRMIIFSHSSVIASPDKSEVKKVHIIFPRCGQDYDRLNSLFIKFSLLQEGDIQKVDDEIYKTCFYYTMTAKIAPIWNVLGLNYFVNNRDFLISTSPQEGIKCIPTVSSNAINLQLKPVKINLFRSSDLFLPGEWIRVLPSLNKAVVEEYYETLPSKGDFKYYKDLRRHWKNIHGYRLPEEKRSYYAIRFWRGEPLTYPDICVIRNFPVITPLPKSSAKLVLIKFINCLRNKMPFILGKPINIYNYDCESIDEKYLHTQAISLCTPTQHKVGYEMNNNQKITYLKK